MTRSFAVAAVLLNVLLVSACGEGEDKEAVATAGEACNEAMTLAQDGEGMSDVVQRNAAAADKAASAANLDERWDSLATAISDYTSSQERQQEQFLASAEALDTDSMNAMLEESVRAKANILAQCRKVKAAGGKVTQSLLDDFIR